MCGIFGMFTKDSVKFTPESYQKTVNKLFQLSETRGKEAAGIALRTGRDIKVFKQPMPASDMIRTKPYKKMFESSFSNGACSADGFIKTSTAVIGHSRLMTNGLQGINANNQPVVKKGIVSVHNGIIVNADELWDENKQLSRETDLDTEILVELIRKYLDDSKDLVSATQKTFKDIKGVASIGTFLEDTNKVLLATNNGSLYILENEKKDLVVFTSELFMLEQFIQDRFFKNLVGEHTKLHVKPGIGQILDIDTLDRVEFTLDSENFTEPDDSNPTFEPLLKNYNIVDLSNEEEDLRRNLKRCSKCILPETMPFITFDSAGVCNYCHSYKKHVPMGKDALEELVSRYRRSDGQPDCVVSFSGGRDSSYGLHYMKKVLNMNPVTYTYDWGMVTDIARRNISRLCGDLGVEHILISADIKEKRRNIKKNVEAWLKKPDLGVIPLFMAGDKQYFYYAEQVRKQSGLELVMFFGNPMEKTSFKVGFCGIHQETTRLYNTALKNKLKLIGYYGKQFATNPGYLNSSLMDTAFAYYSSYMMGHNFHWLFNYIPWDEKEIDKTLKDEYDWEVATDTKQTWRIGDGTAAFYNYIYYTVAGFTEHDTLKSNQIREGLLDRETAVATIDDSNTPRFESIREYLGLIGVDFDDAMKAINSIPKLYV